MGEPMQQPDWSVLDGLNVFLQAETQSTTGDLFIAPGRNDREPPVFLALREVTEFSRSIMVKGLTRAFKALLPKKAKGAATEAVRLMEEYATQTEDMVVMTFTPMVLNEAWMKVGIDPVLGDLIAGQRLAEDAFSPSGKGAQ